MVWVVLTTIPPVVVAQSRVSLWYVSSLPLCQCLSLPLIHSLAVEENTHTHTHTNNKIRFHQCLRLSRFGSVCSRLGASICDRHHHQPRHSLRKNSKHRSLRLQSFAHFALVLLYLAPVGVGVVSRNERTNAHTSSPSNAPMSS